MSETVESTDVQSAQSPASARPELPGWVVPVQFLLTGFRWVEPFIVLVIFVMIFAASSPQFLTSQMLTAVVSVSAPIILFALGMMLTMLVGGIDFSVGGVAALTSMIAVNQIANGQWSAGVALLIALVIGFLFGLLNGTLTVVFRIPAFAITLGMGLFARGIATSISNGRAISLKDNDLNFLGGNGNGVPGAFWISLAISLILWVALLIIWLLRTRTGLREFITKGLQKRLSKEGIVVNLAVIITFAISGLLAALGGMMMTANVRVAYPTAATGQEVPLLAAVVIGSVSLLGGMGNPISVVAGVLAIQILEPGIVASGGSGFNYTWIISLLLIVAATINTPLNLVERWLKHRQSIAKQMKTVAQ